MTGPRVFSHPALLYRGEDAFLAGTLPFVREGLAAGEPVAVAVPGPRLKLLRTHLGASARRVRFIDMTVTGRNPGWIIPGILRAFADAQPAGRVRIIGEPIWAGRSELEYPACVQHEALINLAFAGRNVTILCPYDADELGRDVLDDAAVTHPVLIDHDGERTSSAFAPEAILETWNRPHTDAPFAAVLLFDDGNLAEVRSFTVHHAARLGLADDRLPELELAVNELAANSIVHGGDQGTLRVWADDRHLVCEISDAGHLSDPPAGRLPTPRRPGRVRSAGRRTDLTQDRSSRRGVQETKGMQHTTPGDGMPPTWAEPATTAALPHGVRAESDEPPAGAGGPVPSRLRDRFTMRTT